MSNNELLHAAFEMTGSDSIDAELCLRCMCCVLFKSLHFVLCKGICPTAPECPIVIDRNAHSQSITVN